MLEGVLSLDDRSLVDSREPSKRFLGNCRDFSTLTVTLLRSTGTPSRARCGFASYFEKDKWVDHWIVEYWDDRRWVMLDAQVDDLQREICGLDADPADLPPGHFLHAAAGWLRCEQGEEDPDVFGIFDMRGRWFIESNLGRDFASLNKVEMLPWDDWGLVEVVELQ